MDFLALLFVNYYLRRQKKRTHLLFVSFLFSALALIVLIWMGNTWSYMLAAHFVLNTAMVIWAFGYHGKKYFLENWAFSYFAVILSGGIFQWLVSLSIPFLGFVGMAAATALLGSAVLALLKMRKRRGSHIYPAKLTVNGRSFCVQAYWDSGNQLFDPYTGKSVHILSDEKLYGIIKKEDMLFRYVPFSSLGEENGLIKVINVDELLIFDESEVVRLESAAVGVANGVLFAEKEYELILHASVF